MTELMIERCTLISFVRKFRHLDKLETSSKEKNSVSFVCSLISLFSLDFNLLMGIPSEFATLPDRVTNIDDSIGRLVRAKTTVKQLKLE